MSEMEDRCNRRLQAQIKEPLHENRIRRRLARLNSIACAPADEREVLCEGLPPESRSYVELRAALRESREDTRCLINAIKEKNNDH